MAPAAIWAAPNCFGFVRFGVGPQVEVVLFGVVGHPLQIAVDRRRIDHQGRRGKLFHAVIKRANRLRFNRRLLLRRVLPVANRSPIVASHMKCDLG